MTTNGLHYLEITDFLEMLIKANDQQLVHMAMAIKQEIEKREKVILC